MPDASRSRASALRLIPFVILLHNVEEAVTIGSVLPSLEDRLPETVRGVNLPFSLYVLRRAWRERWYSRRALVALAPVAVVLHGPLLVGLLALILMLGRG
jgi:hypothetical protein